MTVRGMIRLGMALLLLVLMVPMMGAVPVQVQPCSQDAGPAGCIDLTLNPVGILGDVYVDGTQVAVQVGTVRLNLAPGVSHLIEVRNITEATPDFGNIYNYGDLSRANVQVAAGRTRALVLKAVPNYLRGYVRFTCDIRGMVAGQTVQCQVSADGAVLGALNPGEIGQWALTNGVHALHVDLVGADAGLWAPAASDHPVTITGGKAAAVKATYNRKGQLTVNTNLTGVTGDFYVDGALVASQVPEAVVFVAPGAHTVEVQNLVDPTANGIYQYASTPGKATVAANQSRVVTLRPAKQYLVGFAEVTCGIKAVEAGQDVRCAVTADGQGLGTIEPGQKQVYNLAPGAHTINVALNGGQAGIWGPAARDLPVTLVAGKTARVNAGFDRKGIVNLALSDPNVVADLYVDGVQVASQVNSYQVVLDPGVAHQVEGRVLRNTTAPDAFEYDDVAGKVTVRANQTVNFKVAVGRPREKCTGSMSLIKIQNSLSVSLLIRMSGPESVRFLVLPRQTAQYCVLPGDYQVTESAPAFGTKRESKNFAGGGACYSWVFYVGEAPSAGDCSQNPADYRRP